MSDAKLDPKEAAAVSVAVGASMRTAKRRSDEGKAAKRRGSSAMATFWTIVSLIAVLAGMVVFMVQRG